MPNSTAEYWSVDGVSLQTLVQNLSTWGGGREGVPPLRGDDQLIPYMPGRKFVRKVPDSRTIPLEGWLVGSKVVNGRERGDVQTARDNWRALRDLLWTPGRQVALTRRWYDAAGTLRTATAQAQFAGGMEPEVAAGGTLMKFQVDMFLADPFFYGNEVTETLVTGANAKTILGDWNTLKGKIVADAGHSPFTVAVDGLFPHSVSYDAIVSASRQLTVDVEAFRAYEWSAGKTAGISHSGSRFWFSPDPGPVTITVTRTGTVPLKYVYAPAWF